MVIGGDSQLSFVPLLTIASFVFSLFIMISCGLFITSIIHIFGHTLL